MKKILIIEDTQEVRENIAELLELKNYRVLIAENGAVGLQMARLHLPDVIICDVKMPKLNGFELKETLSREEGLCDIPLIYLTAAAQRQDIERGKALGAYAYLTKPFLMEDLLQLVEEAGCL